MKRRGAYAVLAVFLAGLLLVGTSFHFHQPAGQGPDGEDSPCLLCLLAGSVDAPPPVAGGDAGAPPDTAWNVPPPVERGDVAGAPSVSRSRSPPSP